MLTEAEAQQWDAALSDPNNDEGIQALADQIWNRDDLLSHRANDEDAAAILGYILEQPQPLRKRNIRLWPKLSAGIAAAIALIILALYLFKGVDSGTSSVTFANDVAPGGNKAILTLTDGRRISLTDAAKGELAQQSGIRITKTEDGQIVYQAAATKSAGHNGFNTIETPRGGQYMVVLPDNSRVWLNAASSLKYPTNFSSAKKRRVELTGEGYFEVAKDRRHPFIVSAGNQEIEVLGTHFNVNSYHDEPQLKTTLLEGSVKVVSKGREALLTPGQQAVLTGGSIRVQDFNVRLAVAWKNNKFMFENDNIQYIMRMVSRWYDVEVVFEGALPDDKFIGSMSRSEHVSEVLKSLELTGKVKFKVEGRRIVVTK